VTTETVEQGSPEWHEIRSKGIGGSDWCHILNLEPYGCARRLWYSKRGTTPDVPTHETGAMRRGHKLEALVAEEAAAYLGCKIRRIGRIRRPNDLPDWWIGFPDYGIVAKENSGSGVLECKTVNPWRYKKIAANGLPEEWIAQTHHYLGLTGRTWGAIAMLEPVDWLLTVSAIVRDDDVLATMRTAGNHFWTAVEWGPAPPQLDSKDKRCQSCEFRYTCQGEALFDYDVHADKDVEEIEDTELAQLVDQREEIRAIKDDAEDAIEGLNSRIKTKLGGVRKVSCCGHKIYYSQYVTKRLDTKALRSELPDIADRFTRSTASTRLVIY